MGNVATAARVLILGFWLGLISGSSNAAPTSLFIPEEDAWIIAHPIVRTCVDTHWRPFESVKASKMAGIVPSFLDAVARVNGLRFEYVDGVCRNGSLAALRLRQVDMLPDWGKDEAVAPYRDGYIASTPYCVGTIAIITAEQENLFANFSQLSGERLTIRSGGDLGLTIHHSSAPVKLVTFQSEPDALQAVVDSDADAALRTDASIVPWLHRQFKDQLFLPGSPWDRPYMLTMVARDDNPVLVSILDKSLAAISASEADTIRQRWQEMTDYGAPSLVSILHYRWCRIILVTAAVLAFAVLAYVLWRARVAAVRSERERTMFFVFISHEIRTPIYTILASLELLQRSQLADQQASRADAAISASEALLALLGDVLEYSRLELHSVTLAPQPTAIGPRAEQTLDMVRWRSDEGKLALSPDLACVPDFSVEIDAIRVRQIVLNLLVNVIKFTTISKIVLRVDYLPGKRRGSGTLVLEVRDTGMGIPSEHQRNIFEPYVRVESPGNHGVNGTGLGLSICHGLVELIGGMTAVSSSPEVGTVFTIILPAQDARAEIALPKAAEAVGASAPHTISPPRTTKAPSSRSEEGPLVLMVDDHEAVQHAIQHQLEALACRPAIAGTGEAALEWFASVASDMVLLDYNLPGADGYAITQCIWDIEHQRGGERTPIVAISAVTDDTHRVRRFDGGMDGALSEPLHLAALRELTELWYDHGDSGSRTVQVERETESTVDVLAIYRKTIETDLEMLTQGLVDRNIEQVRRTTHRISGAAVVVDDLRTRQVVGELKRHLSEAPGGITADAHAPLTELQSLHPADNATT